MTRLTVAVDNVDNAGWESGLDNEVAEALSSQWRYFGWLQDSQY